MRDKIKILSVDDDPLILILIKRYLENLGYSVHTSSNGEDGLVKFTELKPDAVLLDMNMPQMDGNAVLAKIREISTETPVIIISGSGNMKNVIEALRTGAWDYITKPLEDMAVLQHALTKALERAHMLKENREYKERLEMLVSKRTDELNESNKYLEKTLKEIVISFGAITEKRDPYTAGHQERVSILAGAIASQLGMDDEKIKYIKIAGMLHDVGKVSVPQELLSKPALLASYEFELVKKHPLTGYDIIKNIPFKHPIADIIYQHHERVDGSGYPRGLKGAEIMIESQIIAIADVVEAMASHRPYRPALGLKNALKEIYMNRETAYDRDCADACFEIFNKNTNEISMVRQYFID